MNYPSQNNFANICRTCLVEDSSMKSLFSIEEIMEQKVMLCDMLMSCASILIMQGDGLPENICINCSRQTNTAYLFRKLCERSDATLRECIGFTNLIVEHNNIFNSNLAESRLDLNLENSTAKDDVENNEHFKEISTNVYNQTQENDVNDKNSQDEHYESDKDSSLSNTEVFFCKKCNKFLQDGHSYQPHLKECHGDSFRCEQCGKKFKSNKFLTSHVISMHDNSEGLKKRKIKTGIVKKRNLPRTCEICNKTFRFHSNLERHKLIHTGEKPYLCNVCGKGFAQMAYLKIHSFIHTGEKPYKCQMCTRSFAAPGTLMTHIRTHTGERPHICKICGKDFPQSGYLSAHIRTHTGEKPVECKVCHRRFNQSGRLIIHMRIHSGEKPYQCKECDRSFAVNGTLKKHMRTHTGERPYVCKECGQAFAQSGTMATHMKVHRPKGGGGRVVS